MKMCGPLQLILGAGRFSVTRQRGCAALTLHSARRTSAVSAYTLYAGSWRSYSKQLVRVDIGHDASGNCARIFEHGVHLFIHRFFEQLSKINASQQKKQCRVIVKTRANAVQYRRNMLAHVCPIRARACKRNFLWRWEQAVALVCKEFHQFLRKSA